MNHQTAIRRRRPGRSVVSQNLKTMVSLWGQVARLVWSANPMLATFIVVMTFVTGLIPTLGAYVAALLVDSIVHASKYGVNGGVQAWILFLVVAEGGLIVLSSLIGLVKGHYDRLLKEQISEKIKVAIYEMVLTLDLHHFENADYYDKMQRAKAEIDRPLGVIMSLTGFFQSIVSLASATVLLYHFSTWAIAVVAISSIPGFIISSNMTEKVFRFSNARVPDGRRVSYYENMMTGSDFVKEMRIFCLGGYVLNKYITQSKILRNEQYRMNARNGLVNIGLGLISTGLLYGAYGSAALAAARGAISVGEMTLYLQLFRQSQGTIGGLLSGIQGLYFDRLYLGNLFDFLNFDKGWVDGDNSEGPARAEGLQLSDVTFQYPNSSSPVLKGVNLDLRRGQCVALVGENGAGKTTLIKLLTRLYRPTSGTVSLDGLNFSEWKEEALRKKMTVLFQDVKGYQFVAGHNIGIGDVDYLDDEGRWREAAHAGMTTELIESLPSGYHTQLGGWFNGRELSGGQWQRIALSRAYMKKNADIVILDEPTAAVDAFTEVKMLDYLNEIKDDKIIILISHRFSAVRRADHIVFLENGEVVEQGSHEELMDLRGKYFEMYSVQADAY